MFKCSLLGIEPWTFVQKLGDAVFIPAGCPHQVRNLKVTYITSINRIFRFTFSWVVDALSVCFVCYTVLIFSVDAMKY